jgi:hypothetical protein
MRNLLLAVSTRAGSSSVIPRAADLLVRAIFSRIRALLSGNERAQSLHRPARIENAENDSRSNFRPFLSIEKGTPFAAGDENDFE